MNPGPTAARACAVILRVHHVLEDVKDLLGLCLPQWSGKAGDAGVLSWGLQPSLPPRSLRRIHHPIPGSSADGVGGGSDYIQEKVGRAVAAVVGPCTAMICNSVTSRFYLALVTRGVSSQMIFCHGFMKSST